MTGKKQQPSRKDVMDTSENLWNYTSNKVKKKRKKIIYDNLTVPATIGDA
jgi:hypothetical protein